MRILITLAMLATAAWANAGSSAESCEEMRKVDGRMVFVSVPCVQSEEDTAKKRKCGKDFMALHVGMTMDRFEECNEALSYVTETTDKNGLIETYRSTFYFIHFSKDKVVSFTRRTR